MSTNLPKLSKRAKLALDVLADGGYFRHALETNNYNGREQFITRLLDRKGHVVRGIGFKTRCELEDNDFLVQRDCPTSTTWPTEYILKKGGS